MKILFIVLLEKITGLWVLFEFFFFTSCCWKWLKKGENIIILARLWHFFFLIYVVIVVSMAPIPSRSDVLSSILTIHAFPPAKMEWKKFVLNIQSDDWYVFDELIIILTGSATGRDFKSFLDRWSTRIVPRASHITLIVVRNRSLQNTIQPIISTCLVSRTKAHLDLQEPINGNNNGNVAGWEANSIQDHDHCDQTSLWDTSSTNWSSSRSYTENVSSLIRDHFCLEKPECDNASGMLPHSNDISEWQWNASQLGNENSSNGFI